MQSFVKFAAVALVSLGVSSCTWMGGQKSLEQARAMQSTGTGFDQSMVQNYIALSETEYAQGDTRDGSAYAARAALEAQGQTLLPEEVEARPYLAAEYKPELSAARARLVAALEGGGRESSPADAATAQAMYDCWQEQAEENLQPDHIAACREGFMAAIAQLEAGAAVSPAAYMVFFDWDKYNLTPEAQQIVQAAAEAARKDGYARIVVTGHTDTSGSAEYNEGLSMRRAESVRQALVDLGLPADQITTRALGETSPLVPTGDGVREPQNRRAEIDIDTRGRAGS
jgi:outer membrane protein OmpA-like peptidoglycan-associated protein